MATGGAENVGSVTSTMTSIPDSVAGFVLGTLRFVFEILDRAQGGHHYGAAWIRWIIDMNFLHYAIFMFVVCSLVLVAVSYTAPAPERRRLAGLTFATVYGRIDAQPARETRTEFHPAAETAAEHRINLAFSLLLVVVVVGLWIYFR